MTETSKQSEVSPVFFPDAQKVTVREIAEWAGAEIVRGDSEQIISGVAPLDEGGPGTLVFIDNPKYQGQLETTTATACLVGKKYLSKVRMASFLCWPKTRTVLWQWFWLSFTLRVCGRFQRLQSVLLALVHM